MDIPTHAGLLVKIDEFRARHNDMAETRFGREAINNPNFIRGLREGVSPTLDTLIKVRDYMARIDEEARVRAKLAADPPPTIEEEEQPLPFSPAPVNPTGASSPTSSSTLELRTPSTDSARSTSCSSPEAAK